MNWLLIVLALACAVWFACLAVSAALKRIDAWYTTVRQSTPERAMGMYEDKPLLVRAFERLVS